MRLRSASASDQSSLWQGAIDPLGGEALTGLTRTMQRDGVIASVGNAMGIEFTTTVMPFILRGVRLIGVNSDNEPSLRSHLWQRLGSDLRPRHLAQIAQVHPFNELPSLIDAASGRPHQGAHRHCDPMRLDTQGGAYFEVPDGGFRAMS